MPGSLMDIFAYVGLLTRDLRASSLCPSWVFQSRAWGSDVGSDGSVMRSCCGSDGVVRGQ